MLNHVYFRIFNFYLRAFTPWFYNISPLGLILFPLVHNPLGLLFLWVYNINPLGLLFPLVYNINDGQLLSIIAKHGQPWLNVAL